MPPKFTVLFDRVTVGPDYVEYRRKLPSGIEVVKVWLITEDPRFVCYVERFTEFRRLETTPMSMFLSQIEAYITDAQKRKEEARSPGNSG